MRTTFISNYYTHHQKPFCNEMHALSGDGFCFICTEKFSEERKKLGWQEDGSVPFVLHADRLPNECADAISTADTVILGSAPFSAVTERLERGGLVFKYSERIFKDGYSRLKWLPRVFRYHKVYGRHKSLFLLSAGAYTAGDFSMHGVFRGKSYKWGYFPETKRYDLPALFENKNTKKILWCGRLIWWKHPETAVYLAKRLKADGVDFSMDIMGAGEMEAELSALIAKEDLGGCVRLVGAMPSEQVRAEMEKAGVFIFTSDFREGWGAVLNEAMNSGCAVVASHAVGSAPYLIKQGENGYIYENGREDALYFRVRALLSDVELQRRLGESAYKTITELWNGETAARRFISLAKEIQAHGCCELFEDGPCSRAEAIKNDWFKEDCYDVKGNED